MKRVSIWLPVSVLALLLYALAWLGLEGGAMLLSALKKKTGAEGS